MKNKRQGFSIPLLEFIIVVLVVGGGIYIYSKKNEDKKEISVATQLVNNNNIASTSVNTEMIGWKTYVVPEDNSISFKYPPDWSILGDFHDTMTKVYNRTVKIISPNTYSGTKFVINLWYSPGTTNNLTDCHSNTYKIIKSESVLVSGEKLNIITGTVGSDKSVVENVKLADDSGCYIKVSDGIIQMSGGLGIEEVGGINIDDWKMRPEALIFDEIFKSLQFKR